MSVSLEVGLEFIKRLYHSETLSLTGMSQLHFRLLPEAKH